MLVVGHYYAHSRTKPQDWGSHRQVSIHTLSTFISVLILPHRATRIQLLKCEGEYPSRQRCAIASLNCYSYSKWNIRQSRMSLGQSTMSSTISPPSRALLLIITGDNNERRNFMLCSSGSERLFTTYYEKSFWSQLIIQLGLAESAVHHVVVALSSLHWRFMSSSQHDYAWSASSNDYEFLQYNKAVPDLIKYISKEDHSQDMCFDMLRESLRVQENTS